MTIEYIKNFVSGYVGFDITSKRRFKEYAEARFIFIELAYNYSSDVITLDKLGKAINRDHSTVINGRKKFKDYYKVDKDFRNLYDKLEEIILDQEDIKTAKVIEVDELLKENVNLKRNINRLYKMNEKLLERIKKLENIKYYTIQKVNNLNDIEVVF